MEEAPPRVYILHGEDEFAIGLSVSEIESKIDDTSLAELNTSRIDGRSSSLEDLRMVLGSVPFFVTRRLVIVYDLLSRLSSQDQREKFLEILNTVPASTALVLVERHLIKDDHWLLFWARNSDLKTYVRSHPKLQGLGMVKWIEEQTVQFGGKISHRAASELAGLVGDETRIAYHELQKLLAFNGYEGSISVEDVEMLVLSISQANIFDFVDAIGNRNKERAIEKLRELCEAHDHYQIFLMLVRQVRLVMLAKDILSEGESEKDVARVLQQHSYVAGKISRQSGNFKVSHLESVFRRLLLIDSKVKTGRQEWDVAMESLVADFS